MKMRSLEDLFIDLLRDTYDAEKRILKALPKMAKNASDEELQTAFQEHEQQTEGHVRRLEQVFELFGQKARAKKCVAIEGLIEEGKELMEEDMEESVLDAGLIAAAQKVEHYEIATYGTLRTWAQHLGRDDAARVLEQTLNEEKETDQKLTGLAESSVNVEAMAGR